MEKEVFSKIFLEVCSDLSNFNDKRPKMVLNVNPTELENVLTDYIIKMIGYRISGDYSDSFSEIYKYFENILVNMKSSDFNNVVDFIKKYGDEFTTNIAKYKNVENFINALSNLYANYKSKVYISNRGKSYVIGTITKKDEEPVAATYIENIESLDITLKKFIDSVILGGTKFNSFFDGMDHDDAIKYLLGWVVQNATCSDLNNIEKYFKKYTDFINDDTFSMLIYPTKIGKVLENDLYVMLRKSDVNFETPYYLCYRIKTPNGYIELPNIRLGIEQIGKEKKAHIIATQTSQDENGNIKEAETILKPLLPKSKNFREYNPSHLVSLVVTFGLLKRFGINKVQISDFLPLRYQRLVLEERKNMDELHKHQYRLTNKNLYNYFRMLEFTDDITVKSYPEDNNDFILNIGNNVEFKDEFLNYLYNTTNSMDITNKHNL